MAHDPDSSLWRPLPDAPIAKDVYPELGRDWPSDGLGPVARIAAQLPDPKELPTGSLVIVRSSARPPSAWWARLFLQARFWERRAVAHRAVRCTALLALGYRDVSVSVDSSTRQEVAWGVAITSGRSSSAP